MEVGLAGMERLLSRCVTPSLRFVVDAVTRHRRAGELAAAARVYDLAMEAGVDCAGSMELRSTVAQVLRRTGRGAMMEPSGVGRCGGAASWTTSTSWMGGGELGISF